MVSGDGRGSAALKAGRTITVGQTAPLEGATVCPPSQNPANSFPGRSKGNLYYGYWVEASAITGAAGPSAESGSAGRRVRDSWRSRCSLNGVPPALPTPRGPPGSSEPHAAGSKGTGAAAAAQTHFTLQCATLCRRTPVDLRLIDQLTYLV